MSSVVLATAGYDHTIRFWEATSGICYRTLQYAESQINKLEITYDKQFIAAAGNPHIRLFEVNSNDPQPVLSYEGHVGNVTAVGFQKDSKWMYSGASPARMRLHAPPMREGRKQGACPHQAPTVPGAGGVNRMPHPCRALPRPAQHRSPLTPTQPTL
jgi:WD40 repeat protein